MMDDIAGLARSAGTTVVAQDEVCLETADQSEQHQPASYHVVDCTPGSCT